MPRILLTLPILTLGALSLLAKASAQEAEESKKAVKQVHLKKDVVVSCDKHGESKSIKTHTTEISKKEINRIQASTLSDVLEEQAGLYSTSSIHGQETQLMGLTSEYIVFSVDGMPLLGRTAGIFDVGKVTVGENVGKIELIRGPSLKYGNQALAGVVNIQTPQIQPGLHAHVRSKFDSYGTIDGGLNLSYRESRNGGRVYVNHFNTPGQLIKPEKGSRYESVIPTTSLDVGGKYNFIGDNLHATLNAFYTHQKQLPRQSYISQTAKDTITLKRQNMGMVIDYQLNETAQLTVNAHRSSANYLNKSYKDATLLANTYFDEAMIKTGLGYKQTFNKLYSLHAAVEDYVESANTNRNHIDKVMNTVHGFALVNIQNNWLKNLSMEPGLGYDIVSVESRTNLSPSLNVNYKFPADVAMNVALRQGFKMPSFRHLYNSFNNNGVGYIVIGTTQIKDYIAELQAQNAITDLDENIFNNLKPLKPERSWNYSLSLQKRFKKAQVTATYFTLSLKNMIETRLIAKNSNNGQLIFSYLNLKSVAINGLDLEVRLKLASTLGASVALQYLSAVDTKVAKEKKEEGARYDGLFNRSKYSGNIKLLYSPIPALELSLRSLFRSPYGFMDRDGSSVLDNDKEYLAGYVLFNLAAQTYLLKRKMTLSVGINNIANYTRTDIPTLIGRVLAVELIYQYDRF